jgi:plastocyanin
MKSVADSEGGPGVRASPWRLALAIVVVALVHLCTASAYANPPADAPDAGDGAAGAVIPARVQGPTAVIRMNDDMPMYQPNTVVIEAGQTLEWLNNGEVSHSVVDDPSKANTPDDAALPPGAKPFASGNVMPGNKYRHTFMVPGTYRYFCMSHEADKMIGEVIVKAPAASAARDAADVNSQPWRLAGHPNNPGD